MQIQINNFEYMDVKNICSGAFYPIKGFMTLEEFNSVVDKMKLLDNSYWTLPILLYNKSKINNGGIIELINNNKKIAEMEVESSFKVDKERYVQSVFKTTSLDHPGVKDVFDKPDYAVGGKILKHYFDENEINKVKQTREHFKKLKWKTIAAFHTRNPPHKGHEYLQRIAMGICDGLMVSPVITGIKGGEVSSDLIRKSYEVFMKKYYSPNKTFFIYIDTYARFAGPKEVIFQAIIRKNYGATHFIVGRNMCGVGDFYGKYEAQDFFDLFPDLGIIPIKLKEPMYCKKCENIVSEDHCEHEKISISGTLIRDFLKKGLPIPKEFMRPEVSKLLLENSQLTQEVQKNI